jgi:RHS repeat-associated protein
MVSHVGTAIAADQWCGLPQAWDALVAAGIHKTYADDGAALAACNSVAESHIKTFGGWAGRYELQTCTADPTTKKVTSLLKETTSSTDSDCGTTYATDGIEVLSVGWDFATFNGLDPGKNNECSVATGPARVGNPINMFTGGKTEIVTDYVDPKGVLTLKRMYSTFSGSPSPNSSLGARWRHTYQATLTRSESGGVVTMHVNRPSGSSFAFREAGGVWVADADVRDTLTEITSNGVISGWDVKTSGDIVERYDQNGNLQQVRYRDGETVAITRDQLRRPIRVVDRQGRAINFSYLENVLTQIELPDGKVVSYLIQNDRLQSVSYQTTPGPSPSFSSILYLYDDANDNSLLTGVIDESNQLYASWQYDAQGRATTSRHGGVNSGIDLVSVSYGEDSSTVTTPLGNTSDFEYGIQHGRAKLTEAETRDATCENTSYQSRSYDASGYPETLTSFSGVETSLDYNSRGLETRRTEAANVSAQSRVTETDWHATLSEPVERRIFDASNVLVSKQNWTYNNRGQRLTLTQTDPILGLSRTTTTTYCEQTDVTVGSCPFVGLVKSTNGPRTDVSDVTTYTYRMTDEVSCATAPATCLYRKGDLWRTTNALSQVTETLKYDGAGRPLSVKDPNAVVTDLEYHARGWLTANKVRGADAGSEGDDRITRMEYWPTGLIKKVTQPDGAFTSYAYDAAHRLTDITDNAGNTIHYTLDNAGNRTSEDAKDNTGALRRTLSRIYNQFGQLQTQTDAYAHPTGFTYDANGNADTVTDARTRLTDSDHDPLNRLSRTLQDVGGINAETKFAYDAQDNLTKVTDPKGLETNYAYNGLGDLLQLSSPDTGLTTYTYDSGGNRKTQTDARNTTATYGYDALNRLTGITYPTTSLNVVYTYDTTQAVCITGETFSKGRLTKLTDASGTTQYCYDRFGQLVRKHQVTNGVALTVRYAYNAAGRLLSLTYPDGQTAIYSRDGQGRTTGVSVASAGGECQQVLVSGVQYAPFGPATAWMFGDGSGGSGSMGMEGGSPEGAGESLCVYPPTVSRAFARTLNLNYQPVAIADTWTGGLFLGYEFDPAGNLAKLRTAQQTDPPLATYTYDALNRLTDTKDGPTGTVIEHYAYDATGNRLSLTHPAGVTTPYIYPATSHRLDSVGATARSYDAAGNTTQIGGTARQFDYNDMGRMSQVKAGSAVTMQYVYNGKGEQVRKYLGTANTYTVYDEAGHWLGDYTNTGAPIQQAVWIDDLPVGLMASNGLNYVEADALGTPRAVIDPVRDVAIWKWNLTGEAFGNTAPNQNPDGDANQFVFNMRFPGQRYDAASGLNYNYFRNYETATGRYVESDAIGLSGGISTYGYAYQSPGLFYDPNGQVALAAGCFVWPVGTAICAGSAAGVAYFGWRASTQLSGQPDEGAESSGWGDDGELSHPSHSEEASALATQPGDDCNNLAWAIRVLTVAINWRKGNLNPFHVGTRNYVGHQQRIGILRAHLERLRRAYREHCGDPDECT